MSLKLSPSLAQPVAPFDQASDHRATLLSCLSGLIFSFATQSSSLTLSCSLRANVGECLVVVICVAVQRAVVVALRKCVALVISVPVQRAFAR